MKLKLLFWMFTLIILSCQTKSDVKIDWSSSFSDNNVEGAFVLYNTKTKQSHFHNEERAKIRFLPASTFKILNSLISLDYKVVKDEHEMIKWDGRERNYKVWNQDHNMKSALPISCVWFYQELARRIGTERMQQSLNKVSYGNQLMGSNIDDFWLVGDIKTSAVEQVELLDKLIKNNLPFKKETQEKVKSLMITDSTDLYTIHSKTGWGVVEPQIGWIVGWVETKKDTYVFALNIEIKGRSDLKLRNEILYEVLRKEEII